MTQTKTVYAASSGEYSDYRVHGIYERKEDAEAEVARHNAEFNRPEYGDGFVEEFEYHLADGKPLDMEPR